jgi:hypothetical protein
VKFRVAWGVRAEGAELFDLIVVHTRVTTEMHPAIKEHRAMPGAEDEAVAIEPFRLGRKMIQRVAVEDGADFRTAQRQPQMATGAGVDGIHGEAAGFSRGAGKGRQIE